MPMSPVQTAADETNGKRGSTGSVEESRLFFLNVYLTSHISSPKIPIKIRLVSETHLQIHESICKSCDFKRIED